MTGEITLRGRVLPIGGLKEKVLAALRAGIKTVLFPRANEKDLQDIPDYVKKRVQLVPVAHLDEVFSIAFKDKSNMITNTKNGRVGARSSSARRSATKHAGA